MCKLINKDSFKDFLSNIIISSSTEGEINLKKEISLE